MKTPTLLATVVAVALLPLLATAVPEIDGGGRHGRAVLRGYAEVPSVSTAGEGSFRLTFKLDAAEVEWELAYAGLEGDVEQAHVHFAQAGVSGPIVVFLCTNLGNGPPGTPTCPAAPAVLSGTFDADDVLTAGDSGIEAGELEELVRAIRAGATYVNVHSDAFPGGEIRGQILTDLRRVVDKRPRPDQP